MKRAILAFFIWLLYTSVALAQGIGASADISVPQGNGSAAYLLTSPTFTYPSLLITPVTGSTTEIRWTSGTTNTIAASATSPVMPSGGICYAQGSANTYVSFYGVSAATTVHLTQLTICPPGIGFAGGSGGGGTGGGGGSGTVGQPVPGTATYTGIQSPTGTLIGASGSVWGTAPSGNVFGANTNVLATVLAANAATSGNQTAVQSAIGSFSTAMNNVQGNALGAPVPVSGFRPNAAFVSLSVGLTSARVPLPSNPPSSTIVVENMGGNPACINLGSSTVAATSSGSLCTNSEYVPGNTNIPFAVGSNSYIAAIQTSAGATSLNISGGAGAYTGLNSSGGAITSWGGTQVGSASAVGTETGGSVQTVNARITNPSGAPAQIAGSVICSNCAPTNAWSPTGSPVTLTATTTSAPVALPAGVAAGSNIVVYNNGPNQVYVAFGGSGVIATSANDMIPPYSGAEFTMQSGQTFIATITRVTGQTANVNVILGSGQYLATGGPINVANALLNTTAPGSATMTGGIDNAGLIQAVGSTLAGVSSTKPVFGIQGVNGGIPIAETPPADTTSGPYTATVADIASTCTTTTGTPAQTSCTGAPTANSVMGPITFNSTQNASANLTIPTGTTATVLAEVTSSGATAISGNTANWVQAAPVLILGTTSNTSSFTSTTYGIQVNLASQTGLRFRVTSISGGGTITLNPVVFSLRSAGGASSGGSGGGGGGTVAADTNANLSGTISAQNNAATALVVQNWTNGRAILTGSATLNSTISSTGLAGWNSGVWDCTGLGALNLNRFSVVVTGSGNTVWRRVATFTGPAAEVPVNLAAMNGSMVVADQWTAGTTPSCTLRVSVNQLITDDMAVPVQAPLGAAGSANTISTTQVVAAVPGELIYVPPMKEVANSADSANAQWQWVYGTGTNCGTGVQNLSAPRNFAAGNGYGMSGVQGQTLTVPPGNALCLKLLAAQEVDYELAYSYR